MKNTHEIEIKPLAYKPTTHSYYCSDTNYHSKEIRNSFETWNDYTEQWSALDINYNYIFRFDIYANYNSDTKEEDFNDLRLKLFFILQRQGIFSPVIINHIAKEDMVEITEMLLEHKKYSSELWVDFDET